MELEFLPEKHRIATYVMTFPAQVVRVSGLFRILLINTLFIGASSVANTSTVADVRTLCGPDVVSASLLFQLCLDPAKCGRTKKKKW